MTKQVTISFFAILLALSFGLSSQAQAQFQSDYEIRQNFLEENQRLFQDLKEVDDLEEAENLIDEINQLEDQYSDHSDLLDRVFSPETYDQRVTNLRELAEVTHRRLQRLDATEGDVSHLDEEIAQLSDSLEQNNERIGELESQLASMRNARNAYRNQSANLRRQISERDEFILDMVDSIFVAYNDIELESLSPAEVEELGLDVDIENVLGHIESVIDNNINFLDTHTQLSSEDFLHLYAVQVEFERMWENLGPKLANIYEGQQERQQRLSAIDSDMNEWRNQVDESAWSSVSAAFDEYGIDIMEFDDAVSFYTSLNTYLDDAIERAQEEGGSEEELERYQQFADVWTEEVKIRWQPHLVDANLLNYENVASVDDKLSTWKVNAQPRSYAFLMYLGLAVVIILILGGLWLRERSQNQTQQSSGSKART